MYTKQHGEENRVASQAASELLDGLTYDEAVRRVATGSPLRELQAQFPDMSEKRLKKALSSVIRGILTAEYKKREGAKGEIGNE